MRRMLTVQRAWRGLWLVAIPVWLSGCATVGTRTAATQTDRLMRFYDDLQSGRFVVIADFENEHHMELVELIANSHAARCTLDARRGRRETGRRALAFRCGSDQDAVVFSNAHANGWYLKRDWRAYDMLLLSLFSPRGDLTADLTIFSGVARSRTAAHSLIPLDRGWNLIRLDLADVSERIPLDDVQQLRLSVGGAAKPVVVHVDDLILARNRKTLFGDPANTGGAMYVERVGRRWNVGAGGCLELVFSNGQIVGWYDLVTDPYRRRNLVAPGVLGPTPMVLDDASGKNDSTGRGQAVRVHPSILEMNDVRVVIACDWSLFNADQDFGRRGASQHWLYTVYPTGQVYVAVDYEASSGDERVPLGLAVGLTATSEDAVQTSTMGGEDRSITYGLIQSDPTKYAMLFVLDRLCRLHVVQSRDGDGRKEVTMVASQSKQVDEGGHWLCQLYLASGATLSPESARGRAMAFVEPPPLRMQVGAALSPAPGAPGLNGFDKRSGSYRLRPEGGVCRFEIGDAKAPAFGPVFTISDSQGQEVWVYVNDLLLGGKARDRNGNWMFQLPETLSQVTRVEVLVRAADAGPAS